MSVNLCYCLSKFLYCYDNACKCMVIYVNLFREQQVQHSVGAGYRSSGEEHYNRNHESKYGTLMS